MEYMRCYKMFMGKNMISFEDWLRVNCKKISEDYFIYKGKKEWIGDLWFDGYVKEL